MEDPKPQRVLITVSKSSGYFEQSWSSTEEMLPIAFDILAEKELLLGTYTSRPEMKLLAKNKYPHMIFILFDIANPSYDPNTAHLYENNKIPVVQVYLGSRQKAYKAGPPVQNRVNKTNADAHNDNGWGSVPPFVLDYTKGFPCYTNPRDKSRWLRPSSQTNCS